MPKQPKNPISAAFDGLDDAAENHRLSSGPRGRRIKTEPAGSAPAQAALSVPELWSLLETVPGDYLAMNPTHLLLIAAAPGVGKTTLAVRTAEAEAAKGKRVLYLGPRKDFFADVLAIAAHPEWWKPWHSRNHQDADQRFDMCYRAIAMGKWLERGYDGMEFCKNPRICGFDYVNDGCAYHAQKRTDARIIFGQHHHLTLGHPLMETFDVIIGDENPMDAFLRHWCFDARFILPQGMDPAEPLTEIVHELQRLTERDIKAEGPELLTLLGGARHVREACELFVMPVGAQALVPALRKADDVDEAPYFHLPSLANLLLRESRAAEAGADYPARIAISKKKLHLLLRYDVNPQAPNKIIWLDGTANQTLYEALFRRPVEVIAPPVALTGHVYQVWSRSNGKHTLVKDQQPTSKADQLQQQIDQIVRSRGYRNPAVITFKDLEAIFTQSAGHFRGMRGTNQFADCDALIVAGTPQPSLDDLYTTARMVFFDRKEAFARTWSTRDVAYAYIAPDGTGRSYPTSGFWDDEQLHALLWQVREAEIIQAAHRGRPILRDVDIWLLTNVPIAELPPTELLSIQELFDAPEDVDPYRWVEVLRVADAFFDDDRPLRSVDLVEQLRVSAFTARHYLDCLEARQPHRWRSEKVLVPNKEGKVGRPAQALVPQALNT